MNTWHILLAVAVTAGLLTLLYLYLIMPALKKKKELPQIKRFYYAHRGLHGLRRAAVPAAVRLTARTENAPENSMAAFRAAVNAGYGIEMDVRLTKDKVPVIFHDPDLLRVCGVSGRVSDLTYEELRKFRLEGTDQHIPRFQDVLEMVDGQVPLLIEYKTERPDVTVCRVCDRILAHYRGLYFIESFNPLVLYWYRKNRPRIVRGQLSAKFRRAASPIHYLYLSPLHHLLFNFLTKPDFIAYDYTCAGAWSRRICRKLYGSLSAAWTIRSREDMEHMRKQFDLFIFEGFCP